MKYYAQLVALGCFKRKDVVEMTGSAEAANSLIYSYKKRGLIDSVRRDLFVTISIETMQPIPSRYAVASNLADSAYVSHHSAFEYYGIANQVYYEIYVAAVSPFRAFEYDGVIYRRVSPGLAEGVETKRDGVRVTDMERTVLDGINDFEKIAGLEELLRCLELAPRLNEDKLLSYLAAYNSGFLYQKTGYTLGYFKEQLGLSDSFFTTCCENTPKSKRYFYHGVQYESPFLDRKWRLYVPKDLMSFTRKGDVYIE